jgi:hypothetical protein
MSKITSKIACVLSTGIVFAVAPIASSHAASRCDVPRAGPEAYACAVAMQGSTELRRFIERTRGIYGLSYWDYARPEPDVAATKAASDSSGQPTTMAQSDGRSGS